MKYYFLIKKSGKCGCSSRLWKVTEEYDTKAALRKNNSNVREVWTEEQLEQKYGSGASQIKAQAIEW